MSRRRIAFARVNQETHALSPLDTRFEDFRRTHFLEGEGLRAACARGSAEIEGLFADAELSGFCREARRTLPDAELIPLLSAWAIPGGPLSRACYDELRSRLEDRLRRAGPVDAVYVALHGAMGARGVRDPETGLLEVIRGVVGDDVPIAASYDLHGNMTQARIDHATFHSAYHTNPHRDHARVGARAARLLAGTLTNGRRPATAWRSLPMILGGGVQLDFWKPLSKVFDLQKKAARKPGVLDTSVFTCHPWNDDPELGWSTVVHTDGDAALAEELADALAEACWSIRHELPPTFRTPEDAIREARGARLARRLGAVVISDASDVTSAGAPGASVAMIRALLEHGPDLTSYVAVRADDVIAGLGPVAPGDRIRALVGGTLDPRFPETVELDGVVTHTEVQGPFDRVVVVRVGKTHVVLTERSPLVLAPSFYTSLGLSIWKADVVVVKNFFPFLMYFLPYARKYMFVKTAGLTDWDAAFEIDFAGPVHPRDPVDDWRPTDRRRRGLANEDAQPASSSG